MMTAELSPFLTNLQCANSSLRMRKLSHMGKGGTPDQDADGIKDGDIEKSYMKLPKAHLGRPVVDDIVASLCQQHAAEASIGVIAAGRKNDNVCSSVQCSC